MLRTMWKLMFFKKLRMGKNKNKKRVSSSGNHSGRNITDMNLSSDTGHRNDIEPARQGDRDCMADRTQMPESSGHGETLNTVDHSNMPSPFGLQLSNAEAEQLAAAYSHNANYNQRRNPIYIPPEEIFEFVNFIEEQRIRRENGMDTEYNPIIHERIMAFCQQHMDQLTDKEYPSSYCYSSIEDSRGGFEDPHGDPNILRTQENGYLPLFLLPDSPVDVMSRFFDSLEPPEEEEDQNRGRILVPNQPNETALNAFHEMKRDGSPRPGISRRISYGESSNDAPLSSLHHYIQKYFCTDCYQTVFYRLSDRIEGRHPMTLAEVTDEFYCDRLTALNEGRVRKLLFTPHCLTVNENAFGAEPAPDFCYWLQENCFSNETLTTFHMLDDVRIEHPMTLQQVAKVYERVNRQHQLGHPAWTQGGSQETPQGAFPIFVNDFFEPHRFVPGLWWGKGGQKNGPWTFSQIHDSYLRMWFRGASGTDIDDIAGYTNHYGEIKGDNSDVGDRYFSIRETQLERNDITDGNTLIEDIAYSQGSSDEDTSRANADVFERHIIGPLLTSYPLRLRQEKSQAGLTVTTTLPSERARQPPLAFQPMYCSELHERRRVMRVNRIKERDLLPTDNEEYFDTNGVKMFDNPFRGNAGASQEVSETPKISPRGRVYLSGPPSQYQTTPAASAHNEAAESHQVAAAATSSSLPVPVVSLSAKRSTKDSTSIEDQLDAESDTDVTQLTPVPKDCFTNILGRVFRVFCRESRDDTTESMKSMESLESKPEPESSEETIAEFFAGLEGYFAEDNFENYILEDHDVDKFRLGVCPDVYYLPADGQLDGYAVPVWFKLGTQRSMRVAARVIIEEDRRNGKSESSESGGRLKDDDRDVAGCFGKWEGN